MKEIGKGPVIAYGPSVQNNLRDYIINTAKNMVMTFSVLLARVLQGLTLMHLLIVMEEVASAQISLPLRYMHTTVETVHQKDVEGVIRLIYQSLLTLENSETFSYFK